jgi:transcriptional regulator with XRE-family HTH domain
MMMAHTPTKEEVRARRKALGMSQTQFGEYVGRGQSAVSGWETGVADMQPNEWLRANRNNVAGPDPITAMKIYLSGPMTGIPDDNRPEFRRVRLELEAAGYVVSSPLDISEDFPDLTYEQYLELDCAEIETCDGIAVMARPGGGLSNGMTVGLHRAIEKDLWIGSVKNWIENSARWEAHEKRKR